MNVLNGNIDVVTKILKFVTESSEELNTCAMVSRDFRLARTNECFQQTRTGIIIIMTTPSDIPVAVWRRWNQHVFIGNRVRLVVILTQLQRGTIYSSSSAELIFRRDSSAEVPASLLARREHSGVKVVGFFKNILPKLKILDIGALAGINAELGSFLSPELAFLYDSRSRIFRCSAADPGGYPFRLMQPFPFPVNNDNNMNSFHEIHIDPFGVCLNVEAPPIAAYCQEVIQLEHEE